MHEGREFSSTAQGQCAETHVTQRARPLRLPAVPSVWAQWCTAVFGARLRFSVDVGGRVWTWQPQWHSAECPSPTHWACTLHGSTGGQPFTCWLDSLAPLALPPLEQEDMAFPSEAPLPEALLAAVMQDVLAESLATLGAALGQQVTLQSMRCAPEEALTLQEGLPFTLTLADCASHAGRTLPAKVKGLLTAAWPHPFLAALYQAATQALAEQKPVMPPWPLPCAVIWRTRPLALADIRTLEMGDVLLMPHGEAGTLPVHLEVGSTGAIGRGTNYFAARWCAVQRTVTLETAMQQNITEYEESAAPDLEDATDTAGAQEDDAVRGDDASLADISPATWDQCRVPIQCHLGEVSVSLAELAALAPGAVLHALDSVEAPVTLWLGATRIGRGALVDVDGRIGVRITEIIAAARKG